MSNAVTIARSLIRSSFPMSEKLACAAVAVALRFWASAAFAKSSSEDAPQPIAAPKQAPLSEPASSPQPEPDPNKQPQSSSVPTSVDANSLGSIAEVKQSKRILWIFPNYRAVSANTQLPPLSLKDKFWLATQDSFDYSSFVTAGILAGVSQAKKSYPEFGQGGKGYGRYYWDAVADQAVGNYLTEAIVPAVTHEDPRYYTLGHGGFFKRTGYAVSRLLITRTTKTVLQPARVPANKSGIKRRRTGAKFWKWDGKKDRPPEALSSFKSDCPLCLTDTHS